MSKTILTEVEGFTPVMDGLLADTSLMTAVVFGRMWRYCQMENGVCYASLGTIAREILVSYKTIQRHVNILVQKGYLEDLTPNLRNRPHTYADTGKVMIEIKMSVAHAVARSQRPSTRSQSPMKIVLKKEEALSAQGFFEKQNAENTALKEGIVDEKQNSNDGGDEKIHLVPQDAPVLNLDEFLKRYQPAELAGTNS